MRTLFAIRGLVRIFGYDGEQVYKLVMTYYNKRCEPRWEGCRDERDIRSMIRQALREQERGQPPA
jgi:hypothetical protein